MNKLFKTSFIIAGLFSSVFVLQTGCAEKKAAENSSEAMTHDQMIERGKYMVTVGGCNDCHSPKTFTEKGPRVDESRILSGSPAGMPLAAIDTNAIAPGKWYLGSADLTAWVGPWGISYSANLTPDSATGSGAWTEDLFLKMLRTGKFMGIDGGRPIMPPMPWEEIAKMTDQDLKCIFAYLKSLPAISNQVHAYVPPNEINRMMTASN
jgi:hypothetical protein